MCDYDDGQVNVRPSPICVPSFVFILQSFISERFMISLVATDIDIKIIPSFVMSYFPRKPQLNLKYPQLRMIDQFSTVCLRSKSVCVCVCVNPQVRSLIHDGIFTEYNALFSA